MASVLTLEQLGRVIPSATRALDYQVMTGKALSPDSYGGTVEENAAAHRLVQSAGGTKEGFDKSVTALLSLYLPNGVDAVKLSATVEKAAEPARPVFKNDKITVEFLENGSKRVTLHCKGKTLTDMADTIPERGYGFDLDLKEDPTYREGSVTTGKPIIMAEDIGFVIDATQSARTLLGLENNYGKGEVSALVIGLAEAEYRIATKGETLLKDDQGNYFDVQVKEYNTKRGYPVRVVYSDDSRVLGYDDCYGAAVVRALPSNS